MQSISIAGWIHIGFFGLLVPFLAWRSRALLDDYASIPRRTHFIRVIVQLLFFLAASLLVAWIEGVAVFPAWKPRAVPGALAMVMVVAGLVIMRPVWRRSIERRERKARFFMPTTAEERRLWGVLSLAAGVSEEVTYRGVLWVLLTAVTGNVWIAAAMASVAFGLSHAVQGWKAAGAVTIIAMLLHGLVALDGTLYPAIMAHVLYDLAAGLEHGKLGDELGYDNLAVSEK
jgi:hypothetical protein